MVKTAATPPGFCVSVAPVPEVVFRLSPRIAPKVSFCTSANGESMPVNPWSGVPPAMMTLLPVTLMFGVRHDVQELSILADGPAFRLKAPAVE